MCISEATATHVSYVYHEYSNSYAVFIFEATATHVSYVHHEYSNSYAVFIFEATATHVSYVHHGYSNSYSRKLTTFILDAATIEYAKLCASLKQQLLS